MYPEMEVAEQETMNTSLSEESKDEIKKEATNVQTSDSSDHHPLREIASVMMTSAGFISPAREGKFMIYELNKSKLNILESRDSCLLYLKDINNTMAQSIPIL